MTNTAHTSTTSHAHDPLAGIEPNPVVIPIQNITERIIHNIETSYRSGEHPAVIVGKDGEPQAALIPYETYLDLLREQIRTQEREEDRLSLRQMARDKAAGRGVEITSTDDLNDYFAGLGGVAAEIAAQQQ